MNDTDFRGLVRRMRSAQRAFFEARKRGANAHTTHVALREACELERRVDQELDAGRDLPFGDTQPD